MNDEKPLSAEHQVSYIRDWKEVKRQAEEKWELSSRLSKDAAWEIDVADVHLRAAETLPGITDVTGLSDFANRLSHEQQHQLSGLRQYIDYSGTAVISSAAVSTSYSALSVSPSEYSVFGSALDTPAKVETVRTEFEALITKHDRKGEVLELMAKLAFEKHQRGRNAMYQFEAAWDEHDRLSSSPTAPLLTMRAALQFTVDELLERRPNRSGKANQKTKVCKIGEQLAALSVTNDDFDRLQGEYDFLFGSLSEHKAPKGDRTSEFGLLLRSTLFLTQLLNAIDPSRMKA